MIPGGSLGDSIAHELLTPTRIYVSSLSPLIQAGMVKGLAHITGSGFLNIPRLSTQVSYEVYLPSEKERPSVFEWVCSRSRLSFQELAQTFNLGIGMVVVTSKQKSKDVLKKLIRMGETAWIIGETVSRRSKAGSQVFLRDEKNSVTLSY
jgi:phosphoribosylaminoimidazole (AIR) synthetase